MFLFLFLHCFVVFLFSFLYYTVVFFFILTLLCGVFFILALFCGVFVFISILYCGICLYSYIVLWCLSLFLHCFVVFFFILTLFCGVFLYSYIVLWFFSLFLHCFVVFFLYWWTTSTCYSYSVNTISCYITKIITHHPIISPVFINILSLTGTLYVVWLLTFVAIEKYNMMFIQMLFIVRNWNTPAKKRNK